MTGYGDFHAANQNNNDTIVCLLLAPPAENQRADTIEKHFPEHSLGVSYGLETAMETRDTSKYPRSKSREEGRARGKLIGFMEIIAKPPASPEG